VRLKNTILLRYQILCYST